MIFSSRDLSALDAASRVLASPLAAPDGAAWRREAARLVRQLVGADHAVFGLAGDPEPYVLDGLDAAQWAPYAAHVTPDPVSWRTADPVVDLWLTAHQAAGGGAFDEAVMARALAPHGIRLAHSDLLGAVAHPNRMYGLRGMTAVAVGAHGVVGGGIQMTQERPLSSDPADRVRLSTLVASFQAGLAAWGRLGAHRAALAGALDPLPEATAAFDADGRERHRNRALVALLDAEHDRPRVEAALAAAVRRLRPFAFARRGEASQGLPSLPTVATARARYALAGTAVAEGTLGPWGGLLVTVTAAAAAR